MEEREVKNATFVEAREGKTWWEEKREGGGELAHRAGTQAWLLIFEPREEL